ncbi:hypothetical protein INT81_08005 [Riemerella anatipestifer]|nr:hypothetical protein [Riemerella anatipestifer]
MRAEGIVGAPFFGGGEKLGLATGELRLKERLPEDRPISLGNSLGLGHAQIFTYTPNVIIVLRLRFLV